MRGWKSALSCFKAWVFLIDYVYNAFTTDDAAVLIAFFSGLQRAQNFHNQTFISNEAFFYPTSVGTVNYISLFLKVGVCLKNSRFRASYIGI